MYCPLPFYHSLVDHQGMYNVCCRTQVPEEQQMSVLDSTVDEWYNGSFMTSLRAAFNNNEKHPVCNGCWKDEANGVQSLRERLLPDYQYINNKKFMSLEVYTGNLCNLKCMMCNSEDSSAFMQETIRVTGIELDKKKYTVADDHWSRVCDIINQGDVRYLTLRGGEPLYNKKLLAMLDAVSKDVAERIVLRITTNATAYNTKWQQILAKFKLVRYMFSIDAVDEVYEYVRFPGKWATVDSNIKQMLAEPNARGMVHSVVHNLTVLHLQSLLDWANNNNLHIELAMVKGRPELDINTLTNNTRELAVNTLADLVKQGYDVERYLNYLIAHPASNWDKFLEFVEPRDKLRGTDYRTVLTQQ